MANNFTRFPITGGDDGVWGPLLLANIRDMVGLNSCKLYDDSGTLKVSQGKIGINDNTNEGMKHLEKPFFSTQFHPEASGGPTDTAHLFDLFIENIKKSKKG